MKPDENPQMIVVFRASLFYWLPIADYQDRMPASYNLIAQQAGRKDPSDPADRRASRQRFIMLLVNQQWCNTAPRCMNRHENIESYRFTFCLPSVNWKNGGLRVIDIIGCIYRSPESPVSIALDLTLLYSPIHNSPSTHSLLIDHPSSLTKSP